MSHVVMAEMVGSIWKVVARAGDTVGPGDTLVILESMKMEIPVSAEVAGVIRDDRHRGRLDRRDRPALMLYAVPEECVDGAGCS